jgi:hypothetical protein
MCSLYAGAVLNIPLSVLAANKNTHETPFVMEYKQISKFRNTGYDAVRRLSLFLYFSKC